MINPYHVGLVLTRHIENAAYLCRKNLIRLSKLWNMDLNFSLSNRMCFHYADASPHVQLQGFLEWNYP